MDSKHEYSSVSQKLLYGAGLLVLLVILLLVVVRFSEQDANDTFVFIPKLKTKSHISQNQSVSTAGVYTNPAYHYSVQYPPHWHYTATSPEVVSFTQDACVDSFGACANPSSIKITSQQVTQGTDLKKFLAEEGISLADGSLIQIAGVPAYMYTMYPAQNEIESTVDQVILIKNNIAFEILGVGSTNEFKVITRSLQFY